MSTSLPTISIVTCSYMQGKFIDSTIRSVLSQQYEQLEYIVVDGGSRDETVEVIQKYADQLAYWVSEKDSGQTDALLKGFRRSSGEIQGWLCSDDLLLPDALNQVGRFFAEHPEVDFVFGDALWIDAAGELISPKKEIDWNRFIYLFDHNYLAQPSCFWRRSLFERAGGLDINLHLTMDSDLWLRFSRHTKPYHLAKYLSCMRFYPEQKTRALKPAGRKEYNMLLRREAPAMSTLPQVITNPLARAMRISLKILSGCYGATPPPSMHQWLEDHRIS